MMTIVTRVYNISTKSAVNKHCTSSMHLWHQATNDLISVWAAVLRRSHTRRKIDLREVGLMAYLVQSATYAALPPVCDLGHLSYGAPCCQCRRSDQETPLTILVSWPVGVERRTIRRSVTPSCALYGNMYGVLRIAWCNV